jgi:hypothetical protein
VDVIAPDTPDTPDEEYADDDSIEVSWSPNTEEDLKEYIVQRAESPNGPWKDVATLDPDTTSYKDKRLDSGKTYYYRIIAVDEDENQSDPSNVLKAETVEPVSFVEQFMWLFLILIIVIVVIIAAAMASRRKKSKPPVQPAQVRPAPQKKALPPPPKRISQPQPEKTVPMVPVTEKPKTPPPKDEAEELPPPPPPPAEDLPPPPPPE